MYKIASIMQTGKVTTFLATVFVVGICFLATGELRAQNRKNNGRPAPKPLDAPEVIQTKQAYEMLLEEYKQSKKDILDLRKQVNVQKTQMSGKKVVDLSAQTEMLDLKREIKRLSKESEGTRQAFVSKIENEDYKDMKRQLLEAEADKKRLDKETGGLSKIAANRLYDAIKARIRVFEDNELLDHSEYQKLSKLLKHKEEMYTQLRRDQIVKMKASGAGQTGSADADAAKSELEAALANSNDLYKELQLAKKAYEVAFAQATVAYKKWLYEQDKIQKREQQRNGSPYRGRRNRRFF